MFGPHELIAKRKLNKWDIFAFFTVGDTDGIYKGKRYFKVTSNHGKFVHITRITAIQNRQVSGDIFALGLFKFILVEIFLDFCQI